MSCRKKKYNEIVFFKKQKKSIRKLFETFQMVSERPFDCLRP